MICLECRADKCDQCLNLFNQKGEKRNPPTKTWCDCHHKTGIYIGPEHCKHLRWNGVEESCPSCGKMPNGPSNSVSVSPSVETVEEGGTETEVEQQIDQAINDVSTAHNNEGKQYKPTRITVPRRNKETPAS